MKSLDLLQIQMQWLGILPRHANQSGKTIRLFLNFAIFGIFLEFFLTTLWYFAFTANTLIEHAESFYVVTFAAVLLTWYSIYLWHRDDFRALFLDLDKIILRSEYLFCFKVSDDQIILCVLGNDNTISNEIYQKTDDKVEMGVKIVDYMVVRVAVPLFNLCPILLTILKDKYSDHTTEPYIQIYPAT